MAQRKTLTEGQVEILRWIANGCPDGVMSGMAHRVSAAALRRRGLVKTSGRRAAWSARVTAAGRAYLRRVDGSNPPRPRQSNVSVTQQLVEQILDAGGTLRVPRWKTADGVDYEHRARLAVRHHKVPAGKHLMVKRRGPELELRLVDLPGAQLTAEPAPVRPPEASARLHPVARAFRDERDQHRVSRPLLARATRIVHALAAESDRRRWPSRAAVAPGAGGWELHFDAPGMLVRLRLFEHGVKVRGEWEDRVRRARARGDVSPLTGREGVSGAYDAGASGVLMLELRSGPSHLFGRVSGAGLIAGLGGLKNGSGTSSPRSTNAFRNSSSMPSTGGWRRNAPRIAPGSRLRNGPRSGVR